MATIKAKAGALLAFDQLKLRRCAGTDAQMQQVSSRKTYKRLAGQALVLAWWCATPVCAQQLSIRYYDTSDGLAAGLVNRSYEDARGYLW